jgi:hypothetical protein
MKKLERNEMKKLKGGILDENNLKCGDACRVQIPDKCPSTCGCAQKTVGVFKCLIAEP